MGKPSGNSEGGLALILLACMAVPVALVSFGVGAVNLAERDLTAHRVEQASQEEREREEDEVTLDRLRHENQQLSRNLDEKRAAIGKQQAEQTAAAQQLATAEQRVDGLRDQISKAERTATELRQKIDEKQSVSVGQLNPGRRSDKNPQWVECRRSTVTLQPQGRPVSLDELKQKSAVFTAAVKAAGYIVFLVRPDGFETFTEARTLAEQAEVEIGYEPVDAVWKLRF